MTIRDELLDPRRRPHHYTAPNRPRPYRKPSPTARLSTILDRASLISLGALMASGTITWALLSTALVLAHLTLEATLAAHHPHRRT